MLIADGRLRAYLDKELPAEEAADLEQELARDSRLRVRLEALASRARECSAFLGALDDGSRAADAEVALSRFREKTQETPRAWRRPAWGALAAALALVAVLASWPPARAAAQRFLGLLRFESVAVLELDRRMLPSNLSDTQVRTFAQVLSDSVEQIERPDDNVDAASVEEAEALAGFPVRLPRDRFDEPNLEVIDSGAAFGFTVERARVETLIDVIGGTDVEIPERLDGARVRVDLFKAVEASYGECWPPSEEGDTDWTSCFELRQGPTPMVVSDPELDLGEIAELGLQVAGMSAEEAQAVRRTLDWTSTLVIPLPEDEARHQEIDVDGVRGILMTDFRRARRSDRPPEYAIVWMRQGITYMLIGFGDPGLGMHLADNLTE